MARLGATLLLVEAAPVILHAQTDTLRSILQVHRRGTRLRVFDNVVERFLSKSVQRHVHAGGQRSDSPADVRADFESRSPSHRLCELPQEIPKCHLSKGS